MATNFCKLDGGNCVNEHQNSEFKMNNIVSQVTKLHCRFSKSIPTRWKQVSLEQVGAKAEKNKIALESVHQSVRPPSCPLPPLCRVR